MLFGGFALIGSCALAPLALCDGDGSHLAVENTFPLVFSRPSNLSTRQHYVAFASLQALSEWSVLAADPRHSIRNGSVISYLVDRAPTYAIVQDTRLLSTRDLFATFDSDGSGLLEATEVWELRLHFLKPFMAGNVFQSSQRRRMAGANSSLVRDSAGRVTHTALLTFMEQHPDVCLTDRLFVTARAPSPQRWRATDFSERLHKNQSKPILPGGLDPDEVEYHASLDRARMHQRLVPVSAIRSVGLSWTIPWMGLPACAGLSVGRLFDPSLPKDGMLDSLASCIFTMVLAFSVYSRSVWPLTRMTANERLTRFVQGWGIFPLVAAVHMADPLKLISTWSLVPTRCLSQVYFLYMVSRPAAGRLASFAEYLIVRSISVGPPWSWLNVLPSAFVRCPICRVLTSKDAAVQGVFAVDDTKCCVCLEEAASVCLSCGHLCLCGRCLGELAARTNCPTVQC